MPATLGVSAQSGTQAVCYTFVEHSQALRLATAVAIAGGTTLSVLLVAFLYTPILSLNNGRLEVDKSRNQRQQKNNFARKLLI